MFIPRHHRAWKPEHMRGRPSRRCHWCTAGPRPVSELIHVLEAPMRYHFCSEACLTKWRQHRHDRDVVEWLREATGIRAEILKNHRCDATRDKP